MTTPRDPEALLSAYLADGMVVLPDRVVDAVMDEIHRTRRRARFGPRSTRSISRTTLAAAAVVAILALGGAFVLIGVAPRLTPSPDPSPSLRGIAPPSSTPSDPGPSSVPTASPVTDPAGIWIATGTMATPRGDHTAVRLLDGRVLVLGGSGDGSGAASAELYDPLTGTWTATASMANPREGGATLLPDGRVLVGDLEGATPDPASGIHGAEVYDPQSGTWTETGKMINGGVVATLLRDGKVLVTGNGVLPMGDGSAQVFDPDEGTWIAARAA